MCTSQEDATNDAVYGNIDQPPPPPVPAARSDQPPIPPRTKPVQTGPPLPPKQQTYMIAFSLLALLSFVCLFVCLFVATLGNRRREEAEAQSLTDVLTSLRSSTAAHFT